jgi:hypothetical protein
LKKYLYILFIRMNQFNLFLCIFILLTIFIVVQAYFYQKKINATNEKINNMEKFKNQLEKIDYTLDISSIQKILNDYTNLKDVK